MTRCHGGFLLLRLLSSVSIALSLSSSKRETRYFTKELELPPLQPMADAPAHNVVYTKSLPLIYTNDPKVVSSWLGEQISHGGCILGLDVEVGSMEYVYCMYIVFCAFLPEQKEGVMMSYQLHCTGLLL